jgi:hypothetical protein
LALNVGLIPNPGILKLIKVFFLTILAVYSASLFSDFILDGEPSLLFPEVTALADFEVTDLLFNVREKPLPDTNIVLVNFGDLSRRGIAKQIEKIASQKPKVLGIACNFKKLKDPEPDSLLCLSLNKIKHLVLFGKLDYKRNVNNHLFRVDKYNNNEFDSVSYNHPKFAQYGSPGFLNLLVNPIIDRHSVCRYFMHSKNINGKKINSFAMEIANQSDPQKAREFLKRGPKPEPINYRRTMEDYTVIDASEQDSIGFISSVKLKDKTVIMGFLGSRLEKGKITVEDKFFTPLNVAPLEKSIPDMFGVVVQANIVSMILNQDFIHYPGEWTTIFINFLIVFCHILLLTYGHKKLNAYFDLFALSLLLFQIFLFAVLRTYLFLEYSLKLDLNITVGTLALASVIVSISHLPVFNRFSLVSVRNRFQKKASPKKA